MSRLNQERQRELEPERIAHAKNKLSEMSYEIIYQDTSKVKFIHKGEEVTLFPYSGWHTGKTIRDGRGLQNLLKQLMS